MRFTLLLLWMVLIPTQGSYGNYEDAFKSVSEFWNQVRDGFSGPSKSFRARNIGNSPRIKKSTDPFADFHEKMALTARVFAGISLRIGLHNGSMVGDDVIKELLSIDGSVDLDTVKNFKKVDVDALFAKLQSLDLVVDSTGADEIESMVLTMDELVKMSEKTDPVDAAVMNNYIGRVEKLKNRNFDFKAFHRANESFPKALNLIKSYKTKVTTMLGSEFGTLKECLEIVEKMATDARKLHGNLEGFKDLLDDSFFEEPYVRSVLLFNEFYMQKSRLQTPSITGKAKFIEFLTKCNNVATQLSSLKDQVSALTAITASRTSRRPPLKLTSGFLNGFTDLKSLSTDSKDTWLTKAIHKYDADLMETELKPLGSLMEKLKNVDDVWTALSAEKHSRTANKIKEVEDMFQSDLVAAIANGDTAVTTLGGFPVPTDDGIFYNVTRHTIKSIVDFRSVFQSTWTKLDQLVNMEDFKRLENIKFSTFIPTSTDTNVIINEMNKFKEVDALESSLKKLNPKFVELEGDLASDPVKNKTDTVLVYKGKPEINGFATSTKATNLKGYFTKLKGVPELNVLSESVALIKYIRKTQKMATFKNDVEEITKIIENSQSALVNARAVPATIKSTQTPGIDRLLKLEKISEGSQALGGSITVLNTVQQLLSKKANIEKLMDEGRAVAKEIDGIVHQIYSAQQLKTIKKKLTELWGDFGKTWSYFNNLNVNLPTRRSKVTALSPLLNETVDQFNHFAGIADFQEDLRPKIEALNELAVLAPTIDHKEIKTTMEDLVELDLDFSSYNKPLADVKEKVKEAVLLFANAQVPTGSTMSVSTGGPTATTRVSSEGPLSSTSSKYEPARGTSPAVSHTAWIVAVSILSLLLLIALLAATGFGVNWYWMKKKVDKLLEENARLVEEKRVALNEVQHKRVKAEDNLANCNKDIERLKKEVELAEQQAKQAQQSKKGASAKTFEVRFDDENLEALRDLASLRKKLKKKTNEKDALVVQLEETRQRENDSVRALEEADIKYRNSIEMLEKGAEREARLLDLFDKAWTSLPEGMLERRASPEFWKADRYGKLTFVDFTVPEFKYVFSSLEPHRVHEKHIKKHHNRTIIQIPYLMPWLEAQAEVDRQQLSSAKQESLYLRAVQYPIPKAYDHALAADDYDVTRYTCSYGTVGFVCRQPDFTVEGNSAFLEMLWKLAKTEKTKLWGCISYDYCSKLGPKYFHFDPKAPPHRCGRFEVIAHSYKRNFREMLGLDYYKLEIREDPSVNNAPDRRVLFLETFDLNIRWDIVPTTVEFQKMVKYLLVRLARIKKRRMIVMDEDGGPHAAIFMASEYFAQYYATHGCCHASMYHPLEEYLSFRGHVFTRPDQVMFAMSMGLDLMVQGCDKVPAAHKDELVQLMRAQWEAFYNGSDKMEDEKVKKEENLKSLRQLTEGSNHGTIMCEPDPALIKPQPPQ